MLRQIIWTLERKPVRRHLLFILQKYSDDKVVEKKSTHKENKRINITQHSLVPI